jgi:hypothetical protein
MASRGALDQFQSILFPANSTTILIYQINCIDIFERYISMPSYQCSVSSAWYPQHLFLDFPSTLNRQLRHPSNERGIGRTGRTGVFWRRRSKAISTKGMAATGDHHERGFGKIGEDWRPRGELIGVV